MTAALFFLWQLAVLFTGSRIDKRDGDLRGFAKVLEAIRPRPWIRHR